MRGKLAPELSGFIQEINLAIAAAKAQGIVPTPQLARERLQSLAPLLSRRTDVAYCAQRELRADNRTIPVRVYSPDPERKLPVMIYFHGGGHMCGSVELFDPITRQMAEAADCVVISVDYRLAPEFPYPAALEDAQQVLLNYPRLLTEVGYADRVVLTGDSAGGALCASLVMRQATDSRLRIDKQILIYPSVDYTMSHSSIDENGEGYFLEKTRIAWYFDNYFSADEDRKAASPLYGPISKSGPETLVVVAGCDPLRDEGLAYVDKCRSAGLRTELVVFDHMVHAFLNLEDLIPQHCGRLYRAVGNFVNS